MKNIRDFVVPSSANYTEFLRDYLKNNQLPETLSNADTAFDIDFKQAFEDYFLMREIGFDTEELFKHELDIKARLNIPFYIEKATALKTLFNQTFESGYSITQTNNLTNALVNDVNTSERKEYQNALGGDGTLPESALSNGVKATDTRNSTATNTGTITTVYSKNPKFNSLDAIKEMQDEFQNVIKDCLDSFDCLFMQVF